MTIEIGEEDLARIRAEGEEASPDECCGFLIGIDRNGEREVRQVRQVPNACQGEERRNRYTIGPEEFLSGEKAARAEGLAIVGFYHSHPNAPARPSAYDREHAWPWYSYVILSVEDGQAQEVTSWVLEGDRSGFREEIVTTGKQGENRWP